MITHLRDNPRHEYVHIHIQHWEQNKKIFSAERVNYSCNLLTGSLTHSLSHTQLQLMGVYRIQIVELICSTMDELSVNLLRPVTTIVRKTGDDHLNGREEAFHCWRI